MKKNILLIDKSKATIDILELLINQFTEYNLVVELDYKKIVNEYNDNKYEYIIIEHECANSDEIIEYICTKNPKQKVILLSDSIKCPINCLECCKTLNFVRLLKPVEPKEILYYLNIPVSKFNCPNKFVFDSINTIEKLHNFINLKENTYFTYKEIVGDELRISSKSNRVVDLNELSKIQDNINPKYFIYSLDEFNLHVKLK